MVLFLIPCMQEAVHFLDQSAQTGIINSAQHIPYCSLIFILPVNEGKGERGKLLGGFVLASVWENNVNVD